VTSPRRFLLYVILAAWPGVAFCTGYAVSNGNDSGAGSLRQAILDANKNPGSDTISWFIPITVDLKSPLPPMTDSGFFGFFGESRLLRLDGSKLGAGVDGIVANADNVFINGVVVLGFSGNGIVLRGKGDSVDEAWIGIDETATIKGNGGDGILIDGASNVHIGDGLFVEIFGNGRHGIEVRGGSGTKIGNVHDALNKGDGLLIGGGAKGTELIKGPFLTSGEFVANGGYGIEIDDAADTIIQDVRIGTVFGNGTGIITAPNAAGGITIARATNATISFPTTPTVFASMPITDSTGVTLSKFAIRAAKGAGISAIRSGVALKTMTVDQSGEEGIRIAGGSLAMNDVTVTTSHGDGVRVSDGATLNLVASTITRNGGHGIALIAGGSGSKITSATVTGNGGIGLLLDETGGSVTVTSTIRDDAGGAVVIRGAASAGNRLESSAIDVVDADTFGTHYGKAPVLITGGAGGNTIALNSVGGLDGPDIAVESGEKNRITGNTLYPSAGLPIDLGADGATPNDPGDSDGGPNRRQNAPLLASFDGTKVTGAIDAPPGTYDLDFYTHTTPSSLADLWSPAGVVRVTTDAAGHFACSLPVAPQSEPVALIAATAADADGNTSELSAPVAATPPATPAVAIRGMPFVRPASVAALEIVRSGDLDAPLAVSYRTVDRTAKAGLDYTAASGVVTFAKGEAAKVVTIPVSDRACQNLFFQCTFDFTLTSSTPAVPILPSLLSLIVTRDEPLINVVRADQPEGDEPSAAAFLIRRLYASDQPLTLGYHTENGSAVAGDDYIAKSGTLTIAPLERFKYVAIPVIGDRKPEADETFTLVIDRIDGQTLSLPFSVTATLRNDDGVPVVSAGGGPARVVLQRTGGNGTPTSVAWELVGLTPLGEIVEVRDVTQVGDAGAVIGAEGFGGPHEIRFTDVLNGVLLQDHLSGSTTTHDPFLILPSPVVEGDDEVRSVPINVMVIEPRSNAIELDYSVTSNSTATAGVDFDLPPGHLHFEPGERMKTITLKLHGDRAAEANETIALDFRFSVDGVTHSNTVETIVIANDDGPLVIVGADPLRVGAGKRCVTIDSLMPLPDGAHVVATDSQRSNRTIDLHIDRGGSHARGCLDADPDADVSVDFSAPDFVRIDRNHLFIPGPSTRAGRIRVINTIVEEPLSGLGQARFDVTLPAASAAWTFVTLTTVDGTAVAGVDYVPQTFNLQFAPGETRKSVDVPVIGDAVAEGVEWFFLQQVNDAPPFLPAPAPGAAIIYDAGKAPPAPKRRRTAP